MKTAFVLAALCACAMAQGLGGGRPKSCSNVGGPRAEREEFNKEKIEEAKQCMADFAEKEGVDVDAAKQCLKECPKPERSNNGAGRGNKGESKGSGKGGAKGNNQLQQLAKQFGVTKEMGQCFKKAAKPIVQACVANSGVELEVKEDRVGRRDQNKEAREGRQEAREDRQGARQGARQEAEDGESSAKGKGRGGKGQGNGGKGRQGAGNKGSINIEKFLERAESCGAPAQQCVKTALGPLANDAEKAKAAFQSAKKQCFGERPKRPEPTAECKADIARIQQAMEGCDLETKLTVEARTCKIPEEAIKAMKELRAKQQTSRGQRFGGGRTKRAIAFIEEFDL